MTPESNGHEPKAEPLPNPPVAPAQQFALKGDFAAGERTQLPVLEGPDFARGERTQPPVLEGPDFARGERTLPKSDETGDFASGQHQQAPVPEAQAQEK